jgi:hypothetical protein
MGYVSRSHQPIRLMIMPVIEDQKQQLKEIQVQAQEAMARAQQGWIKEAWHKPYIKGEKVWLEGKNL